MFRDTQTLLEREARRSPALAAMITNIATLSEADIQATRMQKWIRQGLLDLKARTEQARTATAMAGSIEPYIVDSVVPDPMGEVRRYLDATCFIQVGKGKGMIEIRTGQLVWLGGNGVWIDTLFSERVDPILLSRSESCGSMTRLQYMDVLRRSRNATDAPYTVLGTEAPPDSRFTIFRPS